MVRFSKVKSACGPLKAYHLLIQRCMLEQRWDCADVFLRKALSHDPHNVNLLLKLAEVEEKLGRKDKAIQTYQRVMALTSWQVQNPHYQKASKKISRITAPSLTPSLAD